MKPKCPMCGEHEFIKVNEPISDQYARINGECYVCVQCGYIAWFNTGYVEFYKERMNTIKGLREKINDAKALIAVLELDTKDLSTHKKELEKYQAELKHRLENIEYFNEDRIDLLKEFIKEKEYIIENGVDPNKVHDINELKNGIKRLEDEIEQYSRPIKLIEEV